MEKRVIHLSLREREKLSKLVRNGKIEADIVKRAYMLLHSDSGMSDVAIAAFLLCSEDTVRRARVRHLTDGLDAALEDQTHPGREPSLNSQQEAYLVALASSNPPDGIAGRLNSSPNGWWTMNKSPRFRPRRCA